MFINTKKAFKINAETKNGLSFEAKAGWIGEVPNWVEEHWFFKALCKDGTVTAIVSTRDKDIQDALEQPPSDNDNGGSGDAELDALRARAAELKIPRATQMGKDKLLVAISEAQAKLQPPDLLAGMDEAALREFAASNNIDISSVAEGASADDLRTAIKAAPGGEQ